MPSFNYSQRNSKDEQGYNDYPPLKPHKEKILIVVKTAPQPSVRYREVVCTAGITEKGKWVRLYPINFRYMDFFRRYKKYQWINVEISKHRGDFRIDSYRPNLKTLRLIGKPLVGGKWGERKKILLPTVSSNFETIKESYEANKVSLGVFKPKEIVDFIIEPDDKDWSNKHKRVLLQLTLFGPQTKRLERIPFKFSYKFICKNPECRGHKMQIIDWELYQLYRNVKESNPYSMDIILKKIRQKWLYEIWSQDRDSYLIVGSVWPHPSFVILGVFWPPKERQLSLL